MKHCLTLREVNCLDTRTQWISSSLLLYVSSLGVLFHCASVEWLTDVEFVLHKVNKGLVLVRLMSCLPQYTHAQLVS